MHLMCILELSPFLFIYLNLFHVASQPYSCDQIDKEECCGYCKDYVMDLAVPDFALKFFYARLYQADRCENHKAEHHAGFKCNPSLKVHEVACVIPQLSMHCSFDYIAGQEFDSCRYQSSHNEYRNWFLYFEQFKYSPYYEKTNAVYRNPGTEEKASVYKA